MCIHQVFWLILAEKEFTERTVDSLQDLQKSSRIRFWTTYPSTVATVMPHNWPIEVTAALVTKCLTCLVPHTVPAGCGDWTLPLVLLLLLPQKHCFSKTCCHQRTYLAEGPCFAAFAPCLEAGVGAWMGGPSSCACVLAAGQVGKKRLLAHQLLV